ncbi:uncharacterized protein LOC106132478 [Amyelois transitella]|uniref:uncharacterized protein LOC106132478 n=1 Tax=Amyelois transitella TaxID=680683 RepID=UPI00067B3C10|nr:uncharacterized protein LOC106132478 [Amyelois transitella]
MEVDTSTEAKTNKTSNYFKLIYKYVYIVGWPNFWTSRPDVPVTIIKYHKKSAIFLDGLCLILVVLELVGIFTQPNLSEKQKSDGKLLGFAHIFLGSYGYILSFYQDNIRAMTYSLTVELKKCYNDYEIEKEMTKKARRHSIAYCLIVISALVSYGVDGFMTCYVTKAGTFVTVITAWPDVNDVSYPADYFRVFAYILWWIFMIRVSGVYVMLISTLVCLGYQYKNLQSYFYSLDGIFEKDHLTSEQKEETYENGLKLGINMHARTLWCTRECEKSYMGVVSGQIVVNITVIILLMAQMLTTERTFGAVAAIVSTMTAMLISTGFFMWNAGDVAVEAASLSTAMFSSGWQNCRGDTSVRVRKLLVVAMRQAQVPVSIGALGIITLSYESYVSIVKSSYSVFSVLY